jgi:hypothetical protein
MDDVHGMVLTSLAAMWQIHYLCRPQRCDATWQQVLAGGVRGKGQDRQCCYNTPCNIAASDCFRPSEHSCSWLIPSTGTSLCRQPSHHGTALSSHPCPCSPVLLRVSLSSSIWITLDQLRSLILGHLGTPPLSLIGLSPLSLAHSSQTTPDHLLSLILDFLHSLIMTSLDPLDVILGYCHHPCHLCIIACLVSFELYLLVASLECFRL